MRWLLLIQLLASSENSKLIASFAVTPAPSRLVSPESMLAEPLLRPTSMSLCCRMPEALSETPSNC